MTQPKLVALIDGSGYAKSVCDYSIWAAEALSIPIELMHVIGRRQGECAGYLWCFVFGCENTNA